ncbi:MAG: hypothetical protein WC661_15995 [Opitutaceae bacterium]|jgi:hypothetical protein
MDLANQIKALPEKRMKLTEERLQKLNPKAAQTAARPAPVPTATSAPITPPVTATPSS